MACSTSTQLSLLALKFLYMAAPLLDCLDNGYVVAIDELDAKLGVADMKTPTLDAPEPWPSESVS